MLANSIPTHELANNKCFSFIFRTFIKIARKKAKGQGALLLVMGMFAKMMGLMGMAGIGALAMKALGVAMAALMMAGMVGLKSLSEKGNDQQHHSVQYVAADAGGHHHRRRRRDLFVEENSPLAMVYRGWRQKNV